MSLDAGGSQTDATVDMTRSTASDASGPTSTSEVKNDKKKRFIIPNIFKSKKYGGSAEFIAKDEHGIQLGSEQKIASTRMKKSLSEREMNPRIEDLDLSEFEHSTFPVNEIQEFRVFVGTWNVGGNTPNSTLNLEDFLQVEGSSDVYVLGSIGWVYGYNMLPLMVSEGNASVQIVYDD